MTEHDVDVGDATLRVRVRSGELMVVFLHGLAGHRGEWRPVIDRLDAGIGIIAPDLRGHGESWQPHRPIAAAPPDLASPSCGRQRVQSLRFASQLRCLITVLRAAFANALSVTSLPAASRTLNTSG